ncbi:hypothetical protein GQ53DRAFT_750156 [Thozetella sp. PMI_491]|nr:hypothetical protein GQ53DRAFT_750156 [Thozetella sp. PMI_491]
MPIIDARELIANGDNSSDVLIGGVHFNLTTLNFWNYTYYPNGTLSNSSWCILAFPPYTPSLVQPNGTFLNVTWCYHPVYPIGQRAGIGLGFAVAFGLCLILTLVNLSKHGKLYLPVERRFVPIGRRWQWYWGAFVSAMALISLLTNVDVDRYYLPELPIVLNSFFWFLLQQGAMATVWEAVRHWGSWMERQFIDPNPFVLSQDDRRSKIEFWMPLFFYFWLWLNFFLIVPRNWGDIEMQRYPEQTRDVAAPTATDARFKAAAFCLFVCWLTVAFSLRHSIKHYYERNRGFLNRAVGLFRFMPLRFSLIMPIALAIPAYQALAAWVFDWSPLKVHGNNLAIYLGGYAPSLLILIIQVVAGFMNPNEDRELLRQRRERGETVNRELGITRKPAWWRRINGELPGEKMRDRIARNVRELGGGRATARGLDATIDARAAAAETASQAGDAVEMQSMPQSGSRSEPVPANFDAARAGATRYTGKSDQRRQDRTVQVAAGLLFPGSQPTSSTTRADLQADGPPPYSERGRTVAGQNRPSSGERTHSTETTNSTSAPPQQVRSMLDV